MDYSLIRTWLNLLPGNWPTDHYTLLGLTRQQFDPATVEQIVLARMDRLRPHQLLHPELVTEGMNRLAQALICLTDETARAAYDAELGPLPDVSSSARNGTREEPSGPRSRHETVVPDPTLLPEIFGGLHGSELQEPIGTDVTQVIDVQYSPELAPPEPLPPAYEIVEDTIPEPLPPAYEVVEEPESVPHPPPSAAEAIVVVPPPLPLWQPPNRRALFRRLAQIRRLLLAWRKLKPLIGEAREPIDRPVLVLAMLETAAEVNPLLEAAPGFVGMPPGPGHLVATLLRQPHLLHTIRALLPDQRRAIASDWQLAETELLREHSRLREVERSGRPFRMRFRSRSNLQRFSRWLGRTPETILLALGVAIVIALLIRASVTR